MSHRLRHYYIKRTNWDCPQDIEENKNKPKPVKLNNTEIELLTQAIEHMNETFLDLTKGLNIDSEHLRRKFERYEKLKTKLLAQEGVPSEDNETRQVETQAT